MYNISDRALFDTSSIGAVKWSHNVDLSAKKYSRAEVTVCRDSHFGESVMRLVRTGTLLLRHQSRVRGFLVNS